MRMESNEHECDQIATYLFSFTFAMIDVVIKVKQTVGRAETGGYRLLNFPDALRNQSRCRRDNKYLVR